MRREVWSRGPVRPLPPSVQRELVRRREVRVEAVRSGDIEWTWHAMADQRVIELAVRDFQAGRLSAASLIAEFGTPAGPGLSCRRDTGLRFLR